MVVALLQAADTFTKGDRQQANYLLEQVRFIITLGRGISFYLTFIINKANNITYLL